jgi:N-acetylmuramoyl-L-alanine amidase
VVIHYTAMPSAEAAANTLCNPDTQVSAHYLIAEDGHVLSLVPEDQRAWHAGAGAWGDVTDVNSRSIGIELANTGAAPFAAPLMDALTELLQGIMQRWAIPPERVIGHSDMAPGRKIDPGPRFDWQRLAREGLAIWPQPTNDSNLDDAGFVDLMHRFGVTATDDPDLLLRTLRLRFRPRHEGARDAVDAGIIRDLATRFPVDVRPSSA